MTSTEILKEFREKYVKALTYQEGGRRYMGFVEPESIESFLTEKLTAFEKEIREETLREVKEEIVQLAIAGKDDRDEMKGILLYSRVLKYFEQLSHQKKNVLKLFKKEKKVEGKSYFDLSAKEKKEIIKKAAKDANKMQSEYLDYKLSHQKKGEI